MVDKKEESIEAYVETKSRGNLYQEMAKSDPLGLFSSVGFTPYNPSVLVSRKGMKVFDDMRKDEQVKAAMGFKKHAVLSSGWEIVSPEGQAADWEVTEFVKWNLAEFFEDTIEEALLGVLTALDYGYSISELIWDKSQTKEHGNKIVLKALKNKRPHEFDFKADEYGELLSDGIIQRTGIKDTSLPVHKFVLFSYEKEFGNHYGKSDLESVYRSWWIKDNAYKWFAMMLERLGIPPIFALYDPSAYTKEQIADLKIVISRLQAATTGIIPKGRGENSLEFWNPELAGESTDVFTKSFERFDLDITRALLMPGLIGATGDATQGSLARATVHFDMFMLVVGYLRSRIEGRVMQEQVVKRLVDLNFSVDEYPTFKFLPIAGEIRTELLTTYITAVEKGIVVKQESDEIHLRKELGFPEVDKDRPEPVVEPTPEDLAAKKKEEDKTAAGKLKEEEEQKKEETKQFFNPNHDEKGQFTSGQVYVKQFDGEGSGNFSQAVLSRGINKYEQVVNFNRIDTSLTDTVNVTREALVKALTDSREALKSFVSRNWDKLPTLVKDIKIKGMNDVESILREFMRVTFEAGRTELKAETYSVSNTKNMSAGKGLFTPTEALQYLNSKAFWIKGIIRDLLIKEAQAIIYNAIQTGELPAETIQKLHNVFEPYIGNPNIIVDDEQLAPYRLETILRTNATDAFNQGRLTEARSFSPGLILAMEFSAILDDRTTEICRELDLRLFRMDDPDLDRFKPPLHFNCRSMLVAVPAGIEIDQEDFVTGEIKGAALDLMSPGFGGNITKLAQEYGGGGDKE